MTIRPMIEADSSSVLELMTVFYNSPAVYQKADERILKKDIADCVGEMPFVEGFVFEENANLLGYAMVAKSYSTEYAGMCVWLEDLYLAPEARGLGIAKKFFEFVEKFYAGQAVRFRLEVVKNNTNAIELYKKCGYNELDYMQMTKEI